MDDQDSWPPPGSGGVEDKETGEVYIAIAVINGLHVHDW
jgi:nicotinamide mononucleotide (NMN) deamidase PncC